MRILFTTRRFPPTTGGMERFAFDLYSSLEEKEEVFLVKWGGKTKLTLPFVIPYLFIKSFWFLLTKKIDVIHMQDGVLAPMGVVLKFFFRKPLTVTIHGLDITFNNALYQSVVPQALNKADKIFCISNAARDEVIKRGVDSSIPVFIPLGITDELNVKHKKRSRSYIENKLSLAPNTRVILSVGRLVERKGVRWFIENVLPNLVKNKINFVFIVVGDGPERTDIEESVRKYNLEQYVKMLGRVDDKMVKNLYNGSDVFVMPNIPIEGDMEGFGRVLLEASLCELPVIATGIEGINDAITDGKNGYLLPAEDKKRYIAKLNDILDNKKSASKFGKTSRHYTLKNFSWRNISEDYIDNYRKLTE